MSDPKTKQSLEPVFKSGYIVETPYGLGEILDEHEPMWLDIKNSYCYPVKLENGTRNAFYEYEMKRATKLHKILA